MTHADQPRSDHTAERQRTIFYTLAVVALTLITTVIVGVTVNNRARVETNRAHDALVALQQACDQVASLGGRCETPPAAVGGKVGRDARDGTDGAPGRPPTQAEITAAVATYLTTHPPQVMPQSLLSPTTMPCPGHLAWVTVRDTAAKATVTFLACVRE